MNLSVIIPVRNGGDHLRRCLEAVARSTRPPDEVLVVDDGSTDDSCARARGLGARVISSAQGVRGPAAARNKGATEARGDVLIFIDADVAVHPDTLALIERRLIEQTEIAALFGSYDDQPPGQSIVSRYKNLFHHYIHQHARREASTFWAGCGAIRCNVFSTLGGFDERYVRPSIEDIELGIRLRRAGYRIWLDRDIQVTHLKEWTLASLLASDIRDRAIPWSRLILTEGVLTNDLNLDVKNRSSAMMLWMAVVFWTAGFFFPWSWLLALLAIITFTTINAGLYGFFAKKGGFGLAFAAAGLHVLYLFYSSIIFFGCALLKLTGITR